LDGGHEHALRELNDALTVIKVLKKERDQMRTQMAQGGGFRQRTETSKARALLGADAAGLIPPPAADNRAAPIESSDDDTSGGTINALIANASWADKKAGVGTGQATAQVDAPLEPQKIEEMLSPDLVFTAKDKE
jgi:hypothetical protein